MASVYSLYSEMVLTMNDSSFFVSSDAQTLSIDRHDSKIQGTSYKLRLSRAR